MSAFSIPIKFIVTHKRADFDEVLAIFLLHQLVEAEEHFPGANTAGIGFWNAGRKTIDGQYATDEWVRKAKLLPIGCGGGEFDEHPVHGRERVTGECAATLVAKKLGVRDRPNLRTLLTFAERVNNTATASPDDISNFIKLHHANGKLDVQEIFDWAHEGIAAKYYEAEPSDDFTVQFIAELMRQQDGSSERGDAWLEVAVGAKALDQHLFEAVTAKEYHEKKILVPFRGLGKGGKVRDMQIMAICSDDPRIHRYARSPFGDRPAVTIQMRSTGNVVIMSNKYDGINLRDVSSAIQVEEAILRGERIPNWEELRQELQHGVWYYFVPGQAVFNGSLTSPETPATRQGLERIVELVKIALSVNEFEPFHQDACRQGRCTASRERPCHWYDWGLARCRDIRYQEIRMMQRR